MSRWVANALLLSAGAIWGIGFVAQSSAMAHLGPLTFVALRFLIATLVLLPFATLETRRLSAQPIEKGLLARFALIGGVMFLGMATQQVGLLTTTVSNSGFLTGLYVVFTPLIAVALFREFPHPVVWPGAALAMFGIFLLSGGNLAELTVGDLLTIIGAVFWATQVVLIARFASSSGRPLLLAATQFAVVSIMAAGGMLVMGEPVELAGIKSAAPELLYTGIVAGALAFTLQIIGQRYTTASQAAIFLSSEAPFAALFGALLLQERLSGGALLGCAAILASMLVVELVPMQSAWRRARRASMAEGR